MIKSSRRFVSAILFLILFMLISNVYAGAERNTGVVNYPELQFEDTGSSLMQIKEEEERTFIINTSTRDLDEFRKLIPINQLT